MLNYDLAVRIQPKLYTLGYLTKMKEAELLPQLMTSWSGAGGEGPASTVRFLR